MVKLLAIDQPGCGCAECIVGEHVPLDSATFEQVAAMLTGKLHNNTARTLKVAVEYRLEDGEHLGDYAEHGRKVVVTINDAYDDERDLKWSFRAELLRTVL